MASAHPEDVTKRLCCAICLEQFKEPKVLTCLHTYCKGCLVKLVKKIGPDHIITCPECRQDAKVSNGDVGKLQSNFWVNNFMTLLSMQDSDSCKKPLICEHCDSGDPAVSRCVDCCVFMCEFCVTAHKRINATKGHQMLSLDEVKRLGSKALVKPAFCGRHRGETLKLFCQTCQETICRDCTIVDHRNHKYDFVADVAERERKAVQSVLQESKAKGSAVEEGLKAVQTMESRIQARMAEVSKKVDVFFDEQVKALQYLRGNLKHEVTTQGQIKLKKLGSQKEMLSLTLAQVRSSIDFAEQALADGDDIELLSMKKQLVERLGQLNSSQLQNKPCKTDYLTLQVNTTIWDIGEMVTLHYTPADPTKCVLSMEGGEEGVMYQTLAGQSVDFVLAVKDGGALKDVENCHIRAVIINENEAAIQQELPVHKNIEDSSYMFSYCPDIDGLYTLSVMVDDENVLGSPFAWKVKAKVDNGTNASLLTSAQEQGVSVYKGKFCWKLRVDFSEIQQTKSNLEIGVSCIKQADGQHYYFDTEIGRYSWECKVLRKTASRFRRSDLIDATISSLLDGDIFSIYLNVDAKKLVIYNTRSKQADIFTIVEGDQVIPIILPWMENAGALKKTGFSLKYD